MLISIPDSGFQSDSGLFQGGTDSGLGIPKVVLTVVFIPTVVYIPTVVSSLSDYSPHFHVIFFSAYPAVRVKFYAYVKLAEMM